MKSFYVFRNEIRQNKSKIALKNDGAIKFEPKKNANILRISTLI